MAAERDRERERDAAAGITSSAATEGKYVPPSRRAGAVRGQRMDDDDGPALRVTNLPEARPARARTPRLRAVSPLLC